MKYFDVFNGDADGICALQQLRLAQPRDNQLVTGVKRDISLLKQVDAQAGDQVTVLDISLDKNRDALQRLLSKGVYVRYFDHHFAGEIPESKFLLSRIDMAADTCTSLIVNDYLRGQHVAWAIVGAFGDNFDTSARQLAADRYSEAQLTQLRELGIGINYNGYGAALDDLYYTPADLLRRLAPFADPLAFIAEDNEVFSTLTQGAREDSDKARAVSAEVMDDKVAVFVLPAEPWARRVAGVYSNELASANPNRAHALLTKLPQGGYVVSVRAPMNNKMGADVLCRSFASGGGRKAAAGINDLPEDMLAEFIDRFRTTYC